MLGHPAVTTMKGYRKVYKVVLFIITMDTENNENDGYDDRLYDEEKDRVSIELIEKVEEIYEEYKTHPFFRNDIDRLTKWVLQAVMNVHGSNKRQA